VNQAAASRDIVACETLKDRRSSALAMARRRPMYSADDLVC